MDPLHKLSDKLWAPYTNFSDNRHEDFEVKVKNEGENKNFQTFHHVHCDPEVFLHHICRDKLSLDSPFKGSPTILFHMITYRRDHNPQGRN